MHWAACSGRQSFCVPPGSIPPEPTWNTSPPSSATTSDTVEDGIRSWRGRFNWRGFWEQDIDNRLTLLAIFRAEAQKRLREGRVTYRWWLNFNFRLSILATPRRKRSTDFAGGLVKELYRTGDWVSDESLEAAYLRPNLEGGDPGTGAVVTTLFSNFPHIIAVPSVEPLGTMPFDRTFLTGVHPVGLTGRAVRADGEKMYPDAFSRHDLEHLHTRIKWDIPPLHGSNHREAWRNKRRRLVLFHNEFIPRADALALREKGMAYLMYYIANHEYPSQLLSFLLTPGKILRYLPFRDIAKDLKKMGSSAPLPEGLYRDSVDHIGDYLMDAAKLFDRMAVEIWDDLGIRPQ